VYSCSTDIQGVLSNYHALFLVRGLLVAHSSGMTRWCGANCCTSTSRGASKLRGVHLTLK
jgi:hypothetical protein